MFLGMDRGRENLVAHNRDTQLHLLLNVFLKNRGADRQRVKLLQSIDGQKLGKHNATFASRQWGVFASRRKGKLPIERFAELIAVLWRLARHQPEERFEDDSAATLLEKITHRPRIVRDQGSRHGQTF